MEEALDQKMLEEELGGHHLQEANFLRFNELPFEAKEAVLAALSERDAVSAALASKELHFVAAPFTGRTYACAACRHNLFFPKDVQPNSGCFFRLEDGSTLALKELPHGCNRTVPTSMVAFSHSNNLYHTGLQDPHPLILLRLQANLVLCSNCNIFLGLQIVSCTPSPAATPAMQAAAGIPSQGWVYIVKPYVRLLKLDGSLASPAESEPIVCSGRRGPGQNPGKPCGNLLSSRDQILSKEHCWDAGSGIERALYLNSMRDGSYFLINHRWQELSQGEMQVADTFCASCKAQIGWKFCDVAPSEELEYGNQNQKGRFGLAMSSMADQPSYDERQQLLLHSRALRPLLFDLDDDDEDDEDDEEDEEPLNPPPQKTGWVVFACKTLPFGLH